MLTFHLLSPTLTVFLTEQLEEEFPYWRHLHGFWRTLPNFNPHTALSEPGQDLAAEALTLIQGRGQDDNGDKGVDEDLDDGKRDNSTKQHDDDESTPILFMYFAFFLVLGNFSSP